MRPLQVTSGAFEDNGRIPVKFTADGANISPPLIWRNIPAAARSLALVVEDPDAPRTQPWVHWVIYGIPPGTSGLPEALPARAALDEPVQAYQGANTWGAIGYGGPQPPKGHGPHHYHFRLFAIGRDLDPRPGLSRDELMEAIKGHIVAAAEVVGTYER